MAALENFRRSELERHIEEMIGRERLSDRGNDDTALPSHKDTDNFS